MKLSPLTKLKLRLAFAVCALALSSLLMGYYFQVLFDLLAQYF